MDTLPLAGPAGKLQESTNQPWRRIIGATVNKYTQEDFKTESTAFYNECEEAIIVIFGTFEKAAEWFDTHPIELDSLYNYCEEKYVIGWTASRAANEWYHLNVAALPIVKTPIIKTPITYYTAKSPPEIEPEVKIARATRAETWKNAYLVSRR